MADHYFVGDVDNSWSNGSNWSSSSGGAGGAGVPGSGDRAIFDVNSPDCNMDVNSSLYHLELRSDFTGKVDCVNRYVRAEYDIHVDGGELDLGTSQNHWFKRKLTRSGSGVITPGTSTIQARYDDTRSNLYTEGDFTLYNFNCEVVTPGVSNKYTNLNLGGGTITVENNLDLPGKGMYGDRTYNLNNGTINLHGNLLNTDDNWTSGTAEVKLVGTGDQSFAYKGNYHFTVDKSSGSAIATRFSCDTGGRYANPEPDITFDDSVDWLTNNIRAYFYAIERPGQGSVRIEIYGPAQTFYQARFHAESNYGDWNHRIDFKGNTHHCNSHVWVYTDYKNRSAYINNGTIEVDGNMYIDIENSNARNGSAIFKMTGNVDRIISFTGGTNKYWNQLRITKSGGAKVTLNNNMSCLNDNIYVDSGVFDLNGHSIGASNLIVYDRLRVKGTESISATKSYQASSSVEFYDDGVDAVVSNIGTSFYNLILGSGKVHIFTAGSTYSVSGDISSSGGKASRSELKSSSTGTQWVLNLSGTSGLTDNVIVSDSDASPGNTVSAIGSVGFSLNNDNWLWGPQLWTVKKDGTAMFSSIQSALAILNGLYMDDDLTINIQDKENYEEVITISGISQASGKTLTILGTFDRTSRTMVSNSVAGDLITINSGRVHVKGLRIDRTESQDDGRNGVRVTTSDDVIISHCELLGNGYFPQEGVTIDAGAGDFYFYNNLARRWGEAAIKGVRGAGDRHHIYNNTFVKNQEVLYYTSYSTSDTDEVRIWNNIFDMDEVQLIECDFFYLFYFDEARTPNHIGYLDYNLYNFRTSDEMYLWKSASLNITDDQGLGYLKSNYPTKEINGLQGDPLFDTYCSDYHISSVVSPARDNAYPISPFDDNDGVDRWYPDRGCYDQGKPSDSVHWDDTQNGTMWIEIEDTRTSGAERNIRIHSDYARLL